MAYNAVAFNPKEWRVAIVGEVTVGTIPTSGFIEIETDEAVKFPNVGDLKLREQRSGSLGRVINDGDLYEHEPGAVHEVTISGIVTTANLPILVENALGVQKQTNGGGDDDVAIVSNHPPDSFTYNTGSSGAYNTVSVLFQGSADINSTYVLGACIIKNLKLKADSNKEGGRFEFEATLETRKSFSSTAVAASGYTITAFTRNYLYLSDFTEDKTVYGNSVILDSFEFMVENPVTYLGNEVISSDYGLPEGYLRSVPNLNVTATCSVKFDTNTAGFEDAARLGTVVSSNGLYLANHAVWGSVTKIGFNMPNAFLDSAEKEDGEYLKVKAVVRMSDPEDGTTEILRVIAG